MRTMIKTTLAIAVALVCALTLAAGDLSPTQNLIVLRAGTQTTELKTITIPASPPVADIELAFDTTASMSQTLSQAKTQAAGIVAGVQALVSNTEFAVVQFRDTGDTPRYQVMTPMTMQLTDIQNGINSLSSGGGGDYPESYNLVFHNSYDPDTDGPIGWRAGSRKFVLVFGDAQPHGNLFTQGFTACSNVVADEFTTSTELAGMNAGKRTLMMILQEAQTTSTNLNCYKQLAAAAFPVGQGVDATTDLPSQIAQLIQEAFSTLQDVHFEVISASPDPADAAWLTLPTLNGPFSAPSSIDTSIGVSVPSGTPAGSYTFVIAAIADGVEIGRQTLTVTVPLKVLVLDPPTAENLAGTSHTVTATLYDALGSISGATITFTVTSGPSASPMSGFAITNAVGVATFTFANSPASIGTNTITATTPDVPDVLTATAEKTWFNNPPVCTNVHATPSVLWPPNHKYVPVAVTGATDPDGSQVTTVVVSVMQDEPLTGGGSGNKEPDAKLTQSNVVLLLAERAGTGDGRVYVLHVVATDPLGASCETDVTVSVPHDQADVAAINSAPPYYDSTQF